MKHTIEGFSQKAARDFKKTVLINSKKSTLKIDVIDLMILRWFADRYPVLEKFYVDDKEYSWVNYKSIMEYMPLLQIQEIPFYKRMQKMVYFGILDQLNRGVSDPLPYYRFGDGYNKLISG